MSQSQRERQEADIYDQMADQCKDPKAVTGGGALRLPPGVKSFSATANDIYLIDFLPYVTQGGNQEVARAGMAWYCFKYYMHKQVGPQKRYLACPAQMCNKPCPICEYHNKGMRQNPDPNTAKELKSLQPQERRLYNVVNTGDWDAGVQVFDVSWACFHKEWKKFFTDQIDRNPEVATFAHPTRGMTVKLMASQEEFNSREFYKYKPLAFVKRKHTYGKDWLDQVTCLEDVITVPSYEELHEAFYQDGASGGESQREHSLPESRPARREPPQAQQEEEPRREAPAPRRQPPQQREEAEEAPPHRQQPPQRNGSHKEQREVREGDTVRYEGKEYTVLVASPDGKIFTLEDTDGARVKGVGAAELEVLGGHPKLTAKKKQPPQPEHSRRLVVYRRMECAVLAENEDGTLDVEDEDGRTYEGVPADAVKEIQTAGRSAPRPKEESREDAEEAPRKPPQRRPAPQEAADDEDVPPAPKRNR